MSYGNGYVYTAVQNARLLTETAQAVSGSLAALSRVYGYDANGRITTITDNAVAGENRAFTYDGLGRLATATGPWGAGAYAYDAVGNLRSWTQGTATHSTIWNMVRNQPTSATTTGYGTRNIAHDARGNVTTLGGLSFVYDETNQPVSVSGATSGTYVYDGNLKRVKQVVGGKTIYNVYSTLTGKVSIVDNATTNERNVMIDAGAASVRWNPVSGAEITYLDHLGSPVASTDWSGGVLWRESYTPFGEKRNDPAANRDKPSFTGHIDDDATGLTYMQARYYDSTLGRFLSSDPVGFAKGGVSFFNRYTYTSNDPINLFDPSGRCQVDPNTGTKTGICPTDTAGEKLLTAQLSNPNSIASTVEAQSIKNGVRIDFSTDPDDDNSSYGKAVTYDGENYPGELKIGLQPHQAIGTLVDGGVETLITLATDEVVEHELRV
jgi:RHS repeat-associated protein